MEADRLRPDRLAATGECVRSGEKHQRRSPKIPCLHARGCRLNETPRLLLIAAFGQVRFERKPHDGDHHAASSWEPPVKTAHWVRFSVIDIRASIPVAPTVSASSASSSAGGGGGAALDDAEVRFAAAAFRGVRLTPRERLRVADFRFLTPKETERRRDGRSTPDMPRSRPG